MQNLIGWFVHAGQFIRARVFEKSTLGGIGAAIAAGAGIATPFCYPIIILGVLAVMVPDAAKSDQ